MTSLKVLLLIILRFIPIVYSKEEFYPFGKKSLTKDQGNISNRISILTPFNTTRRRIHFLDRPFPEISLTKCCGENESYVMGFNVCRPTASISPTFKRFFRGRDKGRQWGHSYASIIRNTVFPLNGANDFEHPNIRVFTHNLPACPFGFIHSVSRNFLLFENGSFSIPKLGIWRNHDELCADEFETFNAVEPFKPFVRFCIPDPCLKINCIRKCCPEGMALYSYDERVSCRLTSDSSTIFGNNTIESVSETTAMESYVIQEGVTPITKYSNVAFRMLATEVDGKVPFYINHNGSIFIPSNPPGRQLSEDYCVDYQSNSDNEGVNNRLVGLVCDLKEIISERSIYRTVYAYLLFVSSAFLVATFVVYALIPELHNIQGICVMCHLASLATAYVCMGTNAMNTDIYRPICIGLAIVLHFSFLSAFSWLNVISFYTWWIFRNLQPPTTNRTKKFRRLHFVSCSFFGWGIPFIIVLAGQTLDSTSVSRYDKNDRALISTYGMILLDFGSEKCSLFSNKLATEKYLIGPIGIMIFFNTILFVLTIIAIIQASRDTLAARRNQAKQKFRIIFGLFILMGISYIMEVISFLVGGDSKYWVTTDVLNILTGVIIFIMFVCKPTVWKRLQKRFPCLERLHVVGYPTWLTKIWKRDRPSLEHGASKKSNATRYTPKVEKSTVPTSPLL